VGPTDHIAESNAGRARPILVTGSHRSGSSWVGRMIASSRGVRYLHEPFNPKAYDPQMCALRFEREFTYVCPRNAEPYRVALQQCLQATPRAAWDPRAREPVTVASRPAPTRVSWSWIRRSPRRPLMKDPHAVFSAEWLAATFDMDVVVLIRHPAAFAGSIKKAGWAFDFGQLLAQPLLMERHLYGFRTEIERMAVQRGDLVDQAILLWNLIYHVVSEYRACHSDWIFVRHEDLSRDPVVAFGDIFGRLGLEYTRAARKTVTDHSAPTNPSEQHSGSEIRRHSRANIRNWQQRLTSEEVDRVVAGTATVAAAFYDASDEQRSATNDLRKPEYLDR